MTKLKFTEHTISVEDLPSRAATLSEDEQSQILGGAGFYRSKRMRSTRRSRRFATTPTRGFKPRPKGRPKARPKRPPRRPSSSFTPGKRGLGWRRR